MAFQSVWYFSEIPEDVVDILEDNFDENNTVPEDHWLNGFLWHYILRANRENFLYDVSGIDRSSFKFASFSEGESHTWHTDAEIGDDTVHKISFLLQLSSPDDYEGGNEEFIDESGKSYIAPRRRGCVILFDSGASHRVRKVTKGTKKTIVGWAVGPHWR